jgi:hypothetical protein
MVVVYVPIEADLLVRRHEEDVATDGAVGFDLLLLGWSCLVGGVLDRDILVRWAVLSNRIGHRCW